MFQLHPQLEADTIPVCELGLSRVQLMNNRLFPWVILVPKVTDVRDIIDLAPSKRHVLMDEISQVSEALQRLYRPEKLNVAALGNMVSQLHIHIIARFKDDKAWPHPVWGKGSEPYGPEALKEALGHIQRALTPYVSR